MSSATPLADCVRELARNQPTEIAYYAGDLALSWAAYDAAADRLARVLLALDLPTGARIGVWLPDGAAIHIAFQACERAGLIAMGLGARSGERELAHLLRLSEACGLISNANLGGIETRELVVRLRANGIDLQHHVITAGEATTHDSIFLEENEAPLASAGLLDERGLGPDDVFLFNSTSGTTGLPKIVVHDQLRWMAFHRFAVEVGHLTSQDVMMSAVPAPFGFGIWTSHITPTLLGVPTVVMPRFDASEALTLIERHRVTILAAVSTQFIMMLESNAFDSKNDFALRCLFTGGEAVPEERARQFEERTGASVLQFYGSNETGAVSATRPEDTPEKRYRTAGRPLPEMNLRLFDVDGRDVTSSGTGQPGVNGPALSRGYYGSDKANAELIREDGWVLLGDVVEIDSDGYLRVIGRTDDIIIRGGKNISAAAVEEAVAAHPEIVLAAAVGIPDPIFGERAGVYIELRRNESVDLQNLLEFLDSRNIAREIWPEFLVVLDTLPLSVGGKVAKQVLRVDAAERFTAIETATGHEARAQAARHQPP